MENERKTDNLNLNIWNKFSETRVSVKNLQRYSGLTDYLGQQWYPYLFEDSLHLTPLPRHQYLYSITISAIPALLFIDKMNSLLILSALIVTKILSLMKTILEIFQTIVDTTECHRSRHLKLRGNQFKQ